jgi:2,4-dienoyl-CoA reductase (NADPH2)
VVGAGPAGLSAALYCAQAGFQVTCYEKGSEIGGQFNLARKIPGKEEFNETLRYYQKQFKKYSIQLILNHEVTLSEILKEQPDAVIVATGVKPRLPKIPGIQHPSVIAYDDLIKNFDHHLSKFKAHESIAIIGAGGIGFDVATLLIEKTKTISDYQHYWGIDTSLQQPGALTTPERHLPQQKITLFQRKESKFGSTLGKTTGWIHRQVLKNAQVSFIPGVEYTHIDDNGLHYQTTSKTNQKTSHCYPAQHIILCAGQESVTDLTVSLKDHSIPCITIGGAKLASEVDAKRAIREGLESAIQLKKQL